VRSVNDRGVAPATLLDATFFSKRKRRKEKGVHRGFASAISLDASFFGVKERGAKKPLKGIRGGYR
jgi:hypothetical protein